jgi:hypothetical protein
MGYKINTTWTQLHKNDIEKLNEIIDDEYCNELEIGRKLRLMEVFEEKLNEAIEDFNFYNVIKFMTMTDWKWSNYNGHYSVPNRKEIIECIKVNLFKRGLYEIIELGHKTYGSSTGGLVFDMGITAD